MSSTNADTISQCSDASTLIDGSVISTVPDRHGFLGGSQYSPEPRQGPPPETVLRRERKWLKMLSQWNFYMERNYRKIKERCRKGNEHLGKLITKFEFRLTGCECVVISNCSSALHEGPNRP